MTPAAGINWPFMMIALLRCGESRPHRVIQVPSNFGPVFREPIPAPAAWENCIPVNPSMPIREYRRGHCWYSRRISAAHLRDWIPVYEECS